MEGTPEESGRPLTIGGPALRYLETKGAELVLAVCDEHRESEFYRPFIEHGIRSALVVAVFQGDRIVGAVTVGSRRVNAYTGAHLRLIKLMSSELSSCFPSAAVPVRTAAPQDHEETRAYEPQRPQKEAPAHATPARADEACIEADSLGRIAAWDEKAERLFGWSESEVVGSFLTLFLRRKHRRLLDPTLLGKLLAPGVYRGRALGYDRRGLAVTCEVELSRLSMPRGGAQGFRGVFRRVTSQTLLAREPVEFEFARVYDFSNVLVKG
jgi:PAS domain S-box-containing protein